MSDKRQQLLEASIDLFAQKGFWNTPTSQIAQHAGVATGTLFNYFPCKDALIDAVYLHLKQEWASYIADGFPENGDLKSGMEHLWFRFIDWGINNQARYELMEQLRLSNLVSSQAQARFKQDLAAFRFEERVHAEGNFGDISAEYLGSLVIAQIDVAIHYALTHNLKDMPLNKHISRSFDIFWNGVTS